MTVICKLGMQPRAAVGLSALRVDPLDLTKELLIRDGSGGRRALKPGIVAAGGETQNAAHRTDGEVGLVHLHELPPDFGSRLKEVGTFGNLSVRRLGRLDLLVMKFFARRVGDLEDLEDLAPTPEEIDFVRSQLPSISELYPDRAYRMQLYLDQGESLYRPKVKQEKPRRGHGKGRGM